MKYIELTWQCEICKDEIISYSNKRHDMNFCKCGKSAVDLEHYYMRVHGKVKELMRKTVRLKK